MKRRLEKPGKKRSGRTRIKIHAPTTFQPQITKILTHIKVKGKAATAAITATSWIFFLKNKANFSKKT